MHITELYFSVVLYIAITGSSLSKCKFDGQQCCDEIVVTVVDQGFRSLVQSDKFNFTSGLAGAQTAIDLMRDKTNGMYTILFTLWLLCDLFVTGRINSMWG